MRLSSLISLLLCAYGAVSLTACPALPVATGEQPPSETQDAGPPGTSLCGKSKVFSQIMKYQAAMFDFLVAESKKGALDPNYVSSAFQGLNKEVLALLPKDVSRAVWNAHCDKQFPGEAEQDEYTKCSEAPFPSKDPKTFYVPIVLQYALEEIVKVRETSLKEVCRPGVDYKTQPDGSIKGVENPCHHYGNTGSGVPGYDDGLAVEADLKLLLRLYESGGGPEPWRQSREAIDRINKSGVTLYLNAACTADSAFAKLFGPSLMKGSSKSRSNRIEPKGLAVLPVQEAPKKRPSGLPADAAI